MNNRRKADRRFIWFLLVAFCSIALLFYSIGRYEGSVVELKGCVRP